MVGAESEVFFAEDVTPFLSHMGANIFYCGKNGAGSVAIKVCNNIYGVGNTGSRIMFRNHPDSQECLTRCEHEPTAPDLSSSRLREVKRSRPESSMVLSSFPRSEAASDLGRLATTNFGKFFCPQVNDRGDHLKISQQRIRSRWYFR